MLTAALLFFLLQQKPPDIVFLEQPFNWLQTVVSILQIAFVGFLTIYTFRSTALQKIAERRASWYHKLVIDRMIDEISTFFENADETLLAAVKLAREHRGNKKIGVGPDATKKIAAFKKNLFGLSSELSYRISPFGVQHERKISNVLEELENDITGWFEKEAKAVGHEQRDDLPKLLKQSEVTLFKSLIDIEFQTWGWPPKFHFKKSNR